MLLCISTESITQLKIQLFAERKFNNLLKEANCFDFGGGDFGMSGQHRTYVFRDPTKYCTDNA